MEITTTADILKGLLQVIAANDANYEIRNRCVVAAVASALNCGLAAGFRIDPEEPEWPVAYIELPTGQVSWHLSQHVKPWDGHSTDAKYFRIAEYVGPLHDC